MVLYLGFLSYYIGLYFCFCASTILSWWLLLCSIIWRNEAWFLQLHSTFSRLLWLLEGLLCFHMNCEIFFSSSVKNATGNLIGITLNLQIAFGSIVIFTGLIFPIQQHGISLYQFMSSLTSFISVLYFLCVVFLSS